jgi:Uma2 family endonuclease
LSYEEHFGGRSSEEVGRFGPNALPITGGRMSTVPLSKKKRPRDRDGLPPLENGDRLDQKTFHERYEAMPSDVRAQLIGGTVYMASPQRKDHARLQAILAWWLGEYGAATAGTEVLVNSTTILGHESEPEPDACILPEHGGQTREDENGYLIGAPELVAEVSWATESIDLHGKKRDYERAGICEYIVAALRQQKVYWFVRRRGRFRDLAPGKNGVIRSEMFPGLWLDADALLRRDRKRLLAVIRQGLASPEHEAFMAKLAKVRAVPRGNS